MDWWLHAAEVFYKISLPVGGAIGLYIAFMRVTAANRQAEAQIRQADAATRQAELGRKKQASDLFNQALDQLRHEKVEVRLGAIYSLRQIASESSDDSDIVLGILTAYLRDSPIRWKDDEEPPADVREILGILGSRRSDEK